MDPDNLAKLHCLKQKMQSQTTPASSASDRLTPDDFKSLAKTMGVAEYADHKISVKKRKKPKFNKKNGERPAIANLTKEPKKKKKLNPADTQPKAKRTDWIKSRCTICHAEFVLLPEWKPRPVLCKGCREERKNTRHSRSHKQGRETAFTHTFTSMRVFQGGSPGGGKRR